MRNVVSRIRVSQLGCIRMLCSLVVFALMSGSQAMAQENLSVAGQFGFTFQTETAPVLAVEVATEVMPMLDVYGTLGRMWDTLPGELKDLAEDVDSRFEISAPAFYGMGGVRVRLPVTLAFQPYGLFGIGFARLSGKVEFDGEDITDDFLDITGMDEDELRSTEFAFELGGGATMPLGPGFVDVGYRLMRVSETNISRIYGGFGVQF